MKSSTEHHFYNLLYSSLCSGIRYLPLILSSGKHRPYQEENVTILRVTVTLITWWSLQSFPWLENKRRGVWGANGEHSCKKPRFPRGEKGVWHHSKAEWKRNARGDRGKWRRTTGRGTATPYPIHFRVWDAQVRISPLTCFILCLWGKFCSFN